MGTSLPLDTQFLLQANRRLGLVSAVFAGAVAMLVGTAFLLYGVFGWDEPDHLPHFLAAQTVLFLVSLAMAFMSWRRVFDPVTLVKVGMVYQVLGALILSICAFQGDMLVQPLMAKLSWLAVWILLFPLFVPGPPLRSLAVSLLSASMAPAVFFSWSLLGGHELPQLPVLVESFVPYYVCAGLAVIPAWLVYDLGSTASAARNTARQLGSYQLTDLLGKGGMGEVWRAEHGLLARPAAIKLVGRPTGEAGDPLTERPVEIRKRFEQEAQAIAALTSPHTVSLYDYGLTDDGTLYYAMELLDGLDFETLVKRFGPVSPARSIYLLRQVCESLAEAHRAGLIHRDIKPANLMACRIGGRVDFVKVLDFGLVRRAHDEHDPSVSGANCVLGTPGFMAPEQAKSSAEVDGRADIYALGCVAYWLLTGTMVFEDASGIGMIVKHVQEVPSPPSTRVEQHIPPTLERLVLDCLAKDPDRRPQTAEALMQRLTRLRIGRVWTQQQAHLWWHARLKEFVPRDEEAMPSWSSIQLPPLPPQLEQLEDDLGQLHEGTDTTDLAPFPIVPVSAISDARIRARMRAAANPKLARAGKRAP